jgi:hypothetical protein
MKNLQISLIIVLLSISSVSYGQYIKQWELVEDANLFGQANCDDDNNLELLFITNKPTWQQSLFIIDGVTGEKHVIIQPNWFEKIYGAFFIDVNFDGRSEILVDCKLEVPKLLLFSYGPLGVDEQGVVEMGFAAQNYPNPFNASTRIEYAIEKDGAKVEILIFDQKGTLVMTLDEGIKNRGTQYLDWEGTDSSGKELNPGMYFYKVVVDNIIKTNKMIKL